MQSHKERCKPRILQAYLAGLTFALAASPCSTPVLATLLAYVATKGELVQGAGLLLSYTCGCATAASHVMARLFCNHVDKHAYKIADKVSGGGHQALAGMTASVHVLTGYVVVQVCCASAGSCHICRSTHKGDGNEAVECLGHTCIWRVATCWWHIHPAYSACASLNAG